MQLRRIPVGRTGAEIHVKCEWMNPAGSVKDRPAFRMIEDAELRGLLGPGKILLDSTSGNTGIALAQISAARGHRLTLCLPANASPVRQRLLRHLGAELVLTDALEGPDGARSAALKMRSDQPGTYVFLDQYSNPLNWQAHYDGTAMEIWDQTRGKLTHFVSILGTSGTFTGVSRRLVELNPDVQRIAVQPDSAYHGIEGTKHYESTEVPPIFDSRLVHRQIEVSTDEAREMASRLAREEGLPAGTSGGAAVAAALRIAEKLDQGLIVTILPDHVMKSMADTGWSPR